jgi:hypothetical protein
LTAIALRIRSTTCVCARRHARMSVRPSIHAIVRELGGARVRAHAVKHTKQNGRMHACGGRRQWLCAKRYEYKIHSCHKTNPKHDHGTRSHTHLPVIFVAVGRDAPRAQHGVQALERIEQDRPGLAEHVAKAVRYREEDLQHLRTCGALPSTSRSNNTTRHQSSFTSTPQRPVLKHETNGHVHKYAHTCTHTHKRHPQNALACSCSTSWVHLRAQGRHRQRHRPPPPRAAQTDTTSR